MTSLIRASGRTMNGSSAVADSGSASVIHQAAIHQTSPAQSQAVPGMLAGAGSTSVASIPARPIQKPIRCAVMAAPPPGPELSGYFGEITISIWRPSIRG